MSRLRLVCAALVVAALLGGTTLYAPPLLAEPVISQRPPSADPSGVQPDPNDLYTPVVVVLDTSESMNEKAPGDPAKRIDAARGAVLDLGGAIGDSQQFGLITYPGGGATSGGCSSGNVRIGLGPLNQVELAARVRELSPDGNTPTGPALLHAEELLKSSGKTRATIVLVSDGDANCGDDPCKVAERIKSGGLDVVVNTVGMNINDTGRQKLQCIANATGGVYADANDSAATRKAFQAQSAPFLQLDAMVPAELPKVTGTGAEGTDAVLTLTNTGRFTAVNVRISLDFSDSADRPGAILVPRPVRHLGNLVPGQSRRVAIRIRPDDSLSGRFTWRANAVAENAATATATGASTVIEPGKAFGPVLAGVKRVAVVGDSYSSGEGTQNYLPNTDDKDHGNVCHRSLDSYGAVLFGANARLIACSGAVTGDFYNQQNSGSQKMVPQLLALRAEAVSEASPEAVFLTIGGNDIGFSSIITICTVTSSCQNRPDRSVPGGNYEESVLAKVAALGNNLRRVYRDVDRAVNDQNALARRGGRVAPVVVLPYARITPRSATPGCQLGISGTEVGFLNRLLDSLNLVIAQSVQSLRAEGRPIYYATDVAEAFQPDHTICEDSGSYAVKLDRGEVGGLTWNAILGTNTFDKNELLHPNSAGHAAEARALVSWSGRANVVPVRGQPEWHHSVVDKPGWFTSLVQNSLVPRSIAYEAGSAPKIDARGFAPTSTVVFRVDSAPQVVRSAQADGSGQVSARVPLPRDLPPGTHHIRVQGFTSTGAITEVSYEVRVAPEHTSFALLTAGFGLVLSIAGAWAIRRNARRRRTVR